MQIVRADLSQEVSQNEISTANLSSPIFSLWPARLNQMESSTGQMSNHWEREGHATKLAEAVMRARGGLNLHSNFSKEYICNFFCIMHHQLGCKGRI